MKKDAEYKCFFSFPPVKLFSVLPRQIQLRRIHMFLEVLRIHEHFGVYPDLDPRINVSD
jgi:hypothetical protein